MLTAQNSQVTVSCVDQQPLFRIVELFGPSGGQGFCRHRRVENGHVVAFAKILEMVSRLHREGSIARFKMGQCGTHGSANGEIRRRMAQGRFTWIEPQMIELQMS